MSLMVIWRLSLRLVLSARLHSFISFLQTNKKRLSGSSEGRTLPACLSHSPRAFFFFARVRQSCGTPRKRIKIDTMHVSSFSWQGAWKIFSMSTALLCPHSLCLHAAQARKGTGNLRKKNKKRADRSGERGQIWCMHHTLLLSANALFFLLPIVFFPFAYQYW